MTGMVYNIHHTCLSRVVICGCSVDVIMEWEKENTK